MAVPVSTQSEIFFGWNQEELETLLANLKAQILDEGLDHVTTAALNGKSISQGQRMTLRDWTTYLRAALQELDPVTYGAAVRTSYAVSSFGYMQK